MTSSSQRTQTTDGFQRAFPAFLEARAGKDPAWLQRARQDAFAAFVEYGLPTRKSEAWRHTPVASLAQTEFAAPGAAADAAAALKTHSIGPSAARAVVVNGAFRRDLSSTALPAGVTLKPWADALESPEVRQALARSHESERVFEALNAAFCTDGVFLAIAAGTVVAAPIEIVFLSGGERPYAVHPRGLVVAGANSQATIVETHAPLAAGAGGLTNAVADVVLDAGANLEHLRVQDAAATATHFSAVRVVQRGRDSRYRSRALALGAAVARDSILVELAAEGAGCDLDGLYLANGAQSLDHHTVIDHQRPHTDSRENYKGILGGKSRGAFFGRIIVRKDAQKITAEQQNHNLLVSREALVHSTPQLEIFADDVKCAHGSTIGQLDLQQMFYLRSRGLSAAHAQELLTYAFANEIIDPIAVEPLRERLALRLTRDPQSEHISSAAEAATEDR